MAKKGRRKDRKNAIRQKMASQPQCPECGTLDHSSPFKDDCSYCKKAKTREMEDLLDLYNIPY